MFPTLNSYRQNHISRKLFDIGPRTNTNRIWCTLQIGAKYKIRERGRGRKILIDFDETAMRFEPSKYQFLF